VALPIVQFWECPEGAMLSRPSATWVVALALPAAKACAPRGDRMLSRPGEHAFAASMSKQRDSSLEGRESMAPSSGPRADYLKDPSQQVAGLPPGGCHAFAALCNVGSSPGPAGRESMCATRRQDAVSARGACFRGQHVQATGLVCGGPRKHGTHLHLRTNGRRSPNRPRPHSVSGS